MLAVCLLIKKSIDEIFISLGIWVVDELVNFVKRRRQPGEIERQAANQRITIRFGRWCKFFSFESRKNEIVDLAARPRLQLDRR